MHLAPFRGPRQCWPVGEKITEKVRGALAKARGNPPSSFRDTRCTHQRCTDRAQFGPLPAGNAEREIEARVVSRNRVARYLPLGSRSPRRKPREEDWGQRGEQNFLASPCPALRSRCSRGKPRERGVRQGRCGMRDVSDEISPLLYVRIERNLACMMRLLFRFLWNKAKRDVTSQKSFYYGAQQKWGNTFTRCRLNWCIKHYVHAKFRCSSFNRFGDIGPLIC